MDSFLEKIKKFNEMYRLPNENSPITNHQFFDFKKRVGDFHNIIAEEVEEGLELPLLLESPDSDSEMDFLVDLSDWLGDMIVYCASEARRYGLPIGQILDIIMESNFSKLDENGQPIMDERGKVLKGSNYWRPEVKIRELLEDVLDDKRD